MNTMAQKCTTELSFRELSRKRGQEINFFKERKLKSD